VPYHVTKDIRVAHVRSFVRSDLHGRVNLGVGREVFRALAAEAHSSGTPRILVDLRDTVAAMSAAEVVDLVRGLEGLGVTRNMHVALLLPESGDRIQRGVYVQALATGKGFRIRPFLNFEAAVDWLNQAS
jgi:hypothetical protein